MYIKRIEYIVEGMLTNAFGHEIEHSHRVWGLVKSIIIGEGKPVDGIVLHAASYLHDIGHTMDDPNDPTLENHTERSVQMAEGILETVGFPEEKIPLTLEVIRLHDDTKPWGEHKETDKLEVLYIQDADNIEALGAIGIERLIKYGEKVNMVFYRPELPFDDPTARSKSMIHNIYTHIFLYDNLHTQTAKKIAKGRPEIMKKFIDQYQKEYKIGKDIATASLAE